MTPILAGQPRAVRPEPRPGGKPLIAAAYERHAGALTAYVRDVLGADDPQLVRDADDVAADAWLLITETADRVDDRVLDLNWLRLIARAAARRHREARTPELPSGLVLAAAAAREAGDEDTVLDSLDRVRRPLPRRRPASRAEEFARSHGEPDKWSTTDYEVYDNLARVDHHKAAPVGTVVQLPVVEQPRAVEAVVKAVAA